MIRSSIVIIILSVAMCGCNHTSDDNATKDSLKTVFTIKDKFGQETNNFVVGDKIEFEVVVSNLEDFDVTYSITAPGDHLRAKQGDTLIWSKYYGLAFPQLVQNRILSANETLVYKATWTGINNQGEVVLPGEYTVEGGVILSVNEKFIEQPPSKTIEIN